WGALAVHGRRGRARRVARRLGRVGRRRRAWRARLPRPELGEEGGLPLVVSRPGDRVGGMSSRHALAGRRHAGPRCPRGRRDVRPPPEGWCPWPAMTGRPPQPPRAAENHADLLAPGRFGVRVSAPAEREEDERSRKLKLSFAA